MRRCGPRSCSAPAPVTPGVHHAPLRSVESDPSFLSVGPRTVDRTSPERNPRPEEAVRCPRSPAVSPSASSASSPAANWSPPACRRNTIAAGGADAGRCTGLHPACTAYRVHPRPRTPASSPVSSPPARTRCSRTVRPPGCGASSRRRAATRCRSHRRAIPDPGPGGAPVDRPRSGDHRVGPRPPRHRRRPDHPRLRRRAGHRPRTARRRGPADARHLPHAPAGDRRGARPVRAAGHHSPPGPGARGRAPGIGLRTAGGTVAPGHTA